MLTPSKESYDELGQHIKKQRHHFADKCPYGETYGFSSSHVQMWELDHKDDWGPKNWCFQIVVLKKTLESSLDNREIKPVSPKGSQHWIFHWKNWYGSWSSNILATWCKESTHLQRPWSWEGLRAGGEGGKRGWGGWMASPTWWTWVWASSGSWWWTGKPGMLQSMGSQRLGHHWATELTDWLKCSLT